jgi:hypothetical protein
MNREYKRLKRRLQTAKQEITDAMVDMDTVEGLTDPAAHALSAALAALDAALAAEAEYYEDKQGVK